MNQRSTVRRRIQSLSAAVFVLLLGAYPFVVGESYGSPADGASAALTPTAVSDTLAAMPAPDAGNERSAMAALLAHGPGVVLDLAARLQPPETGGDTATRFALSGLAEYITANGSDQERGAVMGRFLEAALAAESPEARAFLVRQIQIGGGEECVAGLAVLLQDPTVADTAVRALVAIGGRAAGNALLAALPDAAPGLRPALLQGLGDLRVTAAIPQLRAEAASADPQVQQLALYALARTGASRSRHLFRTAFLAAPEEYRSAYAALCLEYARTRGESLIMGRWEGSRICRDVLETARAQGSVSLESAALDSLVVIQGRLALDDLMEAVRERGPEVRRAALRSAERLSGMGCSWRWTRLVDDLEPEAAADVVRWLGTRKHRVAQRAVVRAMTDERQEVRAAAFETAPNLPVPRILPALARVLSDDDEDRASEPLASLDRLGGEQVSATVSGLVPEVRPRVAVGLLEFLAKRGAVDQVEAVYAQTFATEKGVRAAAFAALPAVVTAGDVTRLLERLLQADDDRAVSGLQAALVAAARQIPDEQVRTADMVAAFATAGGKEKVRLLAVLAALEGQEALSTVSAACGADDETVRDAAIRALAAWRDPGAVPAVVAALEQAEQLVHRVLLTRGAVRLVSDADLDPGTKLEIHRQVLAGLERPEEKRLVLGGIGRIRTVDALALAVDLAADEAIRQEALAAAVQIACPTGDDDTGLTAPEVLPLLQRAIRISADGEQIRKLSAQTGRIVVVDQNNLALDRPVLTSCPQEQDHRPELAVDGNSRAPLESAWFGDQWPSWFRVDLEQVVTVDCVRVFFYWDGSRYYQYTVDVSSDGEAWTTVVDESANTVPSTAEGRTHRFEPVPARYVRLSILRNSVNQAVHVVEFQVYAEGGGPVIETPALQVPDADGFVPLFNGVNLAGWTGSTDGYRVENGNIVCPADGGGNLFTEREFDNFHLCFDFKLTPGANNGLGIRAPLQGNPAYAGMELQILDNTAEVYKDLQPYQYHGSIYGVVPAKRGFLAPVGEWNRQEVIAEGNRIRVILNDETIVDADLAEPLAGGTVDNQPHPGLERRSGHIGFLGHGTHVEFRDIRIRTLPNPVPPPGFEALFNGRDLSGWKGLVGDPLSRAAMTPTDLAEARKTADQRMRDHWTVEDGVLVFDGHGDSLCTAKDYADFEMYVDWRIGPGGDSGIYLRGSPQVQIWDPAQWPQGSGGLYNNQQNPSDPLVCADRVIGDWNTFFIRMQGERVSVRLNGILVVDDVVMENYWDRSQPIFPTGQIELQSHHSPLWFRNVYIRELP